jgi:hypothetical protein
MKSSAKARGGRRGYGRKQTSSALTAVRLDELARLALNSVLFDRV